VRGRLDLLETELTGSTKVRLLLAPDGRVAIDSQPITEADCNATHATVAIASRRVDSSDLLRYHKTTRRTLFDEELRDHPGCYDVLFLNERGELAEGGYTNLVLLLRGRLLTPALSCGLLPGVLREELLEAGGISEAVLTMADLAAAEKIWLINSVRGWRECTMEEA
jgi:branched-subunit amino acid aminotransferase/4-amino-4-deoxychorismate lyase